jgi:hypothetical protein
VGRLSVGTEGPEVSVPDGQPRDHVVRATICRATSP